MKIFYADSFLLLNFVLDYLLLVLTAKLSGISVRRLWLMLAAVIGAFFAIWMFFFSGERWEKILFSFITAWIMISIAFSSTSAKKRLRLMGVFLIQSFGFSGLMMALQALGVGRITVANGISYIEIELWQILFSAVGAFVLFQICFRDHSLKLEKQRLLCRAELGEQKVETLLLVDSGNLLYEPLSGKPVILLAPEVVSRLLTGEASARLLEKNWDASVVMAILVEQGVNARLLPLNTASENHLLTLAVKPNRITLERGGKQQKTNEYWIGIARNDIDICGGCRGLIGV